MSSTPNNPPEAFIQSQKGNDLYCRYWNEDVKDEITEPHRGIVFIAHGFGEHCLFYSELAQLLIKSGFYVFAHDHFGHGQSSGKRATISEFDDFVDDILDHVDQVKEKVGDLPVFMIGHSMGGSMSILAAMARPKFFSGVVLVAPLILLDKKAASPTTVFLAKMLAKVFPSMPVGKVDTKAISRNEEQVQRYQEDPLVFHGSIQCGTAVAFQNGLDKIVKNANQIEWPFYVLHGESDALCDVDGSKLLFEKAQSKDKTIKLFPDAFHQLHHELAEVKAETLDTINAWLTERC